MRLIIKKSDWISYRNFGNWEMTEWREDVDYLFLHFLFSCYQILAAYEKF